jgi:hypothetical protein
MYTRTDSKINVMTHLLIVHHDTVVDTMDERILIPLQASKKWKIL